MHEMSIAEALLKQALGIAQKNKLKRIEALEIEVGELQLVVPEALELAFKALSMDTLADGAVLKQRVVPLKAQCRACGHRFAPKINRYLCPDCGQADAAIIAGQDILLKTISGLEETMEGDLEDQSHRKRA